MDDYKDNGVSGDPDSRYIAGQKSPRRNRVYITGDPTPWVGMIDNLENARVVPSRYANIIRAMAVNSRE